MIAVIDHHIGGCMKLVFYWKQDHTKVTGEVLERLVITPSFPFTIYGIGKYDGRLHKVEDMYFVDEDEDNREDI